MTRSNKIALVVILGAAATLVLLWTSASFILKRSGACALTVMFDNKFGDQHLKTTVAHLELYKIRHGHYPDRLSDLDFVGDWDQIALSSVAYYPNEARTRYYVEVTRGWLCSPSLNYPDAFWTGTGYDPNSKAEAPEGDQVRIIHLDPSRPVTRGVETEFTIDVEATLDSNAHGIARVGFNVESPDSYQMIDSHLLDRGTQRFTFTVKVVPVDWGNRARFSVLVNIGPDTSGAKWKPTDSDRRDIEVQS